MRPSGFAVHALSTRTRLVILVAAVLLPVVLFAGALLWRYSVAERDRQQADALELAQRVSGAIDREINGLVAALEALATSPALQEGGRLSDFDQQARAVLRTRGSFVAMRDRTGQQVVNTSRPFGVPLPVASDPVLIATDREVFDKGAPVISDLYLGTVTQLRLVLIDAPVLRNGMVAYALNIALDPSRLADILAASTPPDWTVSLVDRRDLIIARSRQHERFIGSFASDTLRANAVGDGGIWLGTTLEGEQAYSAYTRSGITGWRVAVGVPVATIFDPIQRLVWLLAGSALVVLLVSVALAVRFARQIAEPLSGLAAAAEGLGRREVVPPIRSGLREANAIGQALTTASLAIAQRQAALQASEERFRAAVRAVEGVVWTNDAEGRMTGDQPGWSELTGQTRDAYEGYGWAQAVHPDDAEPTIEAWQRAVASRSTFVFEHRVRGRDGGFRLFSTRAVPVTLPDGSIREWVGVHTDVTDEREARAALAESQARLKAVFDAVPVGVVIAEAPSGRIIDGNAQAARIFRHPLLPSQTIDDYRAWVAFHPDGRQVEGHEYPLGRVIRHGEERPEIEALYRRGDGTDAWVRIIGAPVRDPAGLVTGGVVAILDIDREKRTDAELRELNATLEKRVENAIAERDRIWRLSTELMLVARFDAEVVAINPAWATTLGWAEEDLVGTRFIDLVHPEDIESTLAEAGRLSEGITTLRFENRYRHKDGSYRWLSWTAVPDDRFIHAIARDVTAEHEAAEALRRTEEQLRQSQKMEVVGQLTGGVAHDFNNLLTVVTGHLDMAQRRLEATGQDPRLARNIANAVEGARRAAVLTHRLLAFARQSPLKPEPVDLNRTIEGMSELIRRALGEHIAVNTTLAPALGPTEADVNGIENAILNLCVNARDAMPEGGRLTIETANADLDANDPAVARGDVRAGAYVRLAVRDTGIGMTPEIRERVFEPFFTTKPVGKGTGLGLSQVYGFLRQSGGHAAIRSEPGEGTTVTLYFPRRQLAAEAHDGAQPGSADSLADGTGETILLVEDEDMVREFTVSALEEAGYTVVAAADGPTGLALLDAHPEVRLLFTDIVLAGPLNGRKVADEALRCRPDLKVLFTTGYTRDAAVLPGRPDGGVDLITKPFTAASLTAKVRRLLLGEAEPR
ncbi:MAG: PAS domain S-box protein [Methylobacteriaceae bacterium]|nr:PAS domain S-box protein [Methylobacteriaceae bacterium]